jgi:hypothetical protein
VVELASPLFLYVSVFLEVVAICANPLAALRLLSMEYPVSVFWTSLTLLSTQLRLISLVETVVAVKLVGAVSWAAEAPTG